MAHPADTHTLQRDLHITHYNTNTKHNTQCNSHSLPCDLYNTVRHNKYNTQCNTHTVYSVIYATQCNTHSLQCDLHNTQYNTNNKHDTPYNTHSLQCDLHNTQCNSHSLQCDLNNTLQHKHNTQCNTNNKHNTQCNTNNKHNAQCNTQSTVWFTQHMIHTEHKTQRNTRSLQCNWKHTYSVGWTLVTGTEYLTLLQTSPNKQPVQKVHLNVYVYNQRKNPVIIQLLTLGSTTVLDFTQKKETCHKLCMLVKTID